MIQSRFVVTSVTVSTILCSLGYQTLERFNQSHLPQNLSDKKKHSALIHLNNLWFYSIGTLLLLPMTPIIIEYLCENGDPYMSGPQWYSDCSVGIYAILTGSFIFDLCARKDMDWILFFHHIISLACGLLAADLEIGIEFGILQAGATFLEQPLDYALYLYAINDYRRAKKWFPFAILNFLVVKLLALFAAWIIYMKQVSYQGWIFKISIPVCSLLLLVIQVHTAYVLYLLYKTLQVKSKHS